MKPANMLAPQDPFIRLRLEPQSLVCWNACEAFGGRWKDWLEWLYFGGIHDGSPLCVAFPSISFHCIPSPCRSDKVVDHISSDSFHSYVPNTGVVIALGLLIAKGRRTVICHSSFGDMDTSESCIPFSFLFLTFSCICPSTWVKEGTLA